MAPIVSSRSSALSTARGSGGSSALLRKDFAHGIPSDLICRMSPSSGVLSSSGGVCSMSLPSCSQRGYSRRHVPACTRPARPLRWCAAAFDTQSGCSTASLLSASYEVCFDFPPSTTYTMSSMVIEVSAMLVERMTLRCPSGGRAKTWRCCSVGMPPCNGRSWHPRSTGESRHPSRTFDISSHPLRKTSTAPGPRSAWMCSMARTTMSGSNISSSLHPRMLRAVASEYRERKSGEAYSLSGPRASASAPG
mmetsp:Transcript_12085/g.50868  ORF Transcript_12085/g.50868 Transcript_12085/m.50868 type:complete len:250 (-) Transcript_12085:1736-2485(-)